MEFVRAAKTQNILWKSVARENELSCTRWIYMVLDMLAASYLLINLNTENSKICDKLNMCMSLNIESLKYKETFPW